MNDAKSMLMNVLHALLMFFARRILDRYQPVVVGVTGNVGKTTTKEAIFLGLRADSERAGEVAASGKNYNNELGVPLSIIGADAQGKSVSGWLGVITKGFSLAFFKRDYPKTIILEMGVDKPGDMDVLLGLVHPHIMVVQQIGETPVHLEFFANKDELVAEKAKSVAALKEGDVAVLNFDDPAVRAMAKKTRARVVTFGLGEGADVRATNAKTTIDLGDDPRVGLSCKIEYAGKSLPVQLPHLAAPHQLYAVLAAVAIANEQQKNMVAVLDALREFRAPKGRMNVLAGIKRSVVIDDTYNASPRATLEALQALAAIGQGHRRIAVLGDMLELGEATESAHQDIGREAARCADVVVGVGVRMKFATQEAARSGIAAEFVHEFPDSAAAAAFMDRFVQPGDVVLVKGSQGARMERVVKEIMRDPLRAPELLVRQEKSWQDR